MNELCYHCKLCYNHCPYTPPHEWDVDFPAADAPAAARARERDGIPLARRLTTRTDLLGRIGCAAPPLMNFANRNPLSRWLMEKTVGIDREWVQPSYYAETVERWFAKRDAGDRRRRNGRAVLFTTCSVELQRPARGTLRRARCSSTPASRVELCYERCCGMPFTDTGDMETARDLRRAQRRRRCCPRRGGRDRAGAGPVVLADAEGGVSAPAPERRGAPRRRAATRDLMEYLYELAREKKPAARLPPAARQRRLPRALSPARTRRSASARATCCSSRAPR